MGRRLVRDLALENGNWRVPGAENQVRPVRDRTEHLELLLRKVYEELGEVLFCREGREAEELSDLLEAMQALAEVRGVPWYTVLNAQANKAEKLGGFLTGMVWDTDA